MFTKLKRLSWQIPWLQTNSIDRVQTKLSPWRRVKSSNFPVSNSARSGRVSVIKSRQITFTDDQKDGGEKTE